MLCDIDIQFEIGVRQLFNIIKAPVSARVCENILILQKLVSIRCLSVLKAACVGFDKLSQRMRESVFKHSVSAQAITYRRFAANNRYWKVTRIK